ncbi:MAG: helix-turn-helix domain-containing protein [Akkermansia sp.]
MQVQSKENDSFRSRLQDLLDERGWSQSALARATGLSQAVISKYLLGKSEPGARELGQIAEAFGVTMDVLWRGVKAGTQSANDTAIELAELKHSLRVVFRAMSEPDPSSSVSK